jgi:hypothetical protein
MDGVESLFFGLCISRSLVPDEANDSVLLVLSKVSNKLELLLF